MIGERDGSIDKKGAYFNNIIVGIMVVLEKGRLEMKGSSVLWKIIFVFLGVTILPVVVILAFFYPQNYEVLNHVIEDGLTEPSQRAVERLDEEFLKMFGASLELKSSIQNIAREESGTYLYSRQIKNLLKAVRGRSELVETVLLYQPERGQIYSPTGTISLEYFQSVLYRFHKEEEKELLELSSTAPSVFLAPDFYYNIYNQTQPQPMLVLTYPLSGKMGSVIFFIPESGVRDFLSEFCGESRNYLLYDADTIYLSSSSALSEEEMWGAVRKQRAGAEEDAYITYTGKCKSLGLTYQVFEGKELLYRELDRLHRLTIAIVLLIITAGIAAMLIILRTNYRPLLRILKEIGEVPGLPENARGGSEYERLQSGISQMQRRNSKLKLTLQAYRENYKSLFLYEFLSGSIQEVNDLSDMEERLEIDLYRRALLPVFILARENGETSKRPVLSVVDKLNRHFRGMDSGKIQIVFSACMEKSAFFCLVSMAKEVEKPLFDSLEEFLRREVFGLPEMKGIRPFYAVVGKSGEDIFEAEENVKLLHQFLDSALVRNLPDYSISEAEQLSGAETPELPRPFGAIYELTHAVDCRDMERVHQAVGSIVRLLSSTTTPIAITKLIFGQAMFVFQSVDPDPEGASAWEADGPELCSASQMVQMLSDQERKLSAMFEQEVRSVNTHRRGIKAYVDEHFLDPNFSIAEVAEHYYMQVSNLSAYFKKCYQVTFQQYVSEKKAQKAQALLSQTNITLEEISQQLGYANASSFSRSFKRIVGITPGEYRRG